MSKFNYIYFIFKILINLLQQNRAVKVGGKRRRKEESIKYDCQWSTSWVAAASSIFGNSAIWQNHEMIRTVMMKKMMVVPAKFARYHEYNWWRNLEIGFYVIYAMNISAQSAVTEIFPQMMLFFVVFPSDHKH